MDKSNYYTQITKSDSISNSTKPRTLNDEQFNRLMGRKRKYTDRKEPFTQPDLTPERSKFERIRQKPQYAPPAGPIEGYGRHTRYNNPQIEGPRSPIRIKRQGGAFDDVKINWGK